MALDVVGVWAVDAARVGAVAFDVDCEFDEQGRVYLWGTLTTRPTPDGDAAAPVYRAFGGPDHDLDEQALVAEFGAWLRDALAEAGPDERGRWYHHGNVEARHLRRLLGADAEGLLANATDLLTDVIRPHFYAPGGYSLKRLAPLAGASWRTEGATGADTYGWIEAARTGDETAWGQLVEYNEDDVAALRLLRVALRRLT